MSGSVKVKDVDRSGRTITIKVASRGKTDKRRRKKANQVAKDAGFNPETDYNPMKGMGSQPSNVPGGTGMSPTKNNGRVSSSSDMVTEVFVYDKDNDFDGVTL